MKWINCENDEQVRTIQLPHQNAQNCFLWDREIRFLPTHNQQLHRIVLKIHVGNVQILVMSNNVCSLNAHAIIRNDQHAVSLNSAVVRKVKSYYSSYCKNSKNRKFEAPIYEQTLYAGVKHTQIRDPSLEIKFPTFDNEGIFFLSFNICSLLSFCIILLKTLSLAVRKKNLISKLPFSLSFINFSWTLAHKILLFVLVKEFFIVYIEDYY